MMGAQCPRLDTNSDCLDHDDMVRTTTGNLPLRLDPSCAENYYIHPHTALSAFLPGLLDHQLFQNSLYPLHCSQFNNLPFDFDRHAPKTYHAYWLSIKVDACHTS